MSTTREILEQTREQFGRIESALKDLSKALTENLAPLRKSLETEPPETVKVEEPLEENSKINGFFKKTWPKIFPWLKWIFVPAIIWFAAVQAKNLVATNSVLFNVYLATAITFFEIFCFLIVDAVVLKGNTLDKIANRGLNSAVFAAAVIIAFSANMAFSLSLSGSSFTGDADAGRGSGYPATSTVNEKPLDKEDQGIPNR